MQLSTPRPCPDCSDGKKPDGRLCIVCRGSGSVHLVPAERWRDPNQSSLLATTWSRPESEIYG